MWRVGPDGAVPLDFTPQAPPTDVLTNPSLSPDGRALTAIALGRGIGDCGIATDWGWTGTAFTLLRWREMDLCRGVDPSDWPTLYRATP